MIKTGNLRFCLETACNRLTLCSPTQGKRKDGNFCKRNASKCCGNFPAPWQFSCIEINPKMLFTLSATTGDGCYRLPHKSQSTKGELRKGQIVFGSPCKRLALGKRKNGKFCKRNASKCRGNFPAPWQFSYIEINLATLLTSSATTGDGCNRLPYNSQSTKG